MRRWFGMLVCMVLVLAGGVGARAGQADEVKLRGWYVGWQWTSGARDRWDVFGRADLPPAAVVDEGRGGGFLVGHRFGGRFLLGLQITVTEHDLVDLPEKLYDAEALLTGTVLFRERHTLQPFLRGGFGGGGVVLERPQGDGRTASIGTAAVAGVGLQVRLSSRFSLEWETVANFTNFLEVHDDPDGDDPAGEWRVKTSHVGWRTGVGILVWF